ncbi:MAG TPA: hypothetical protein VGZ90_17850 [Puia sp.]|jgi:hypothetical protein|nr:hypothetical protein [Puia sp.]
MSNPAQSLETLHDIKRIMERSSRFISLSGWSGIAAGICALAGAGFARQRIIHYYQSEYLQIPGAITKLKYDLILIATLTFIAAFTLASFFTFLKSRKEGVAIWGATARRLMWNTFLPLACGGFLIWHLIENDGFGMVAPTSLIFYGLALVNGSKYTMGEVRWLGYGEIILGIVNLWLPGRGIIFWSLGFGVLHIVYGFSMWWKYERVSVAEQKVGDIKAD